MGEGLTEPGPARARSYPGQETAGEQGAVAVGRQVHQAV